MSQINIFWGFAVNQVMKNGSDRQVGSSAGMAMAILKFCCLIAFEKYVHSSYVIIKSIREEISDVPKAFKWRLLMNENQKMDTKIF